MTDRRSFLTAPVVAGAALGIAALDANPAGAQDAIKPVMTEAQIVATLHKDAKYKQVLASVPLKGGVVTHYMVNSYQGVEAGYGAPAGAMHGAAVLYGGSICIVLSDAFWDAHVTDSVLKSFSETPSGAPRKGNPYLHAEPGADPKKSDAVESLLARGASFYVCANALMGLAQRFAREPGFPTNEPPFDVMRRALIPQANLVPAGVAAVMTLQLNGYTFFQASIG